jgi:hypothetical protein
MNRGIVLRFALYLIVAVPTAFLLGAVGEGFASRHDLATPGDILWGFIHPPGSAFSWEYLSGFWTILAIDSLCWLLLMTLISAGVFAIVRVIRARPGCSS